MLTLEEEERYNRHLILDGIGIEGQQKLKQSRVLVIGAGGLGCPVLQYLTGAGVGHVTVMDNDTVSLSNLQRQTLYRTDQIGRPKVVCASEFLYAVNPEIEINGIVDRLDVDLALSVFPDYDVVVDCTDNFETRYAINDAAVIRNKPFVSASVYKYEGQVSVFNFRGGPTYRCLFPDEKSLGFGCNETGVLGVLTGLLGCYQSIEVIKILTGFGEVLSGSVRMINLQTGQDFEIGVERNEKIVEETLSRYNLNESIRRTD